MASKSKIRENIRLQSTESDHFYTTVKNKRNTPDKIQLKKYDPKLRKHVLYKEDKIKK